jgi:FlaA1/EpsC-like NDP-sugar epimerase
VWLRTPAVVAIQLAIVILTNYLAFWLRFDGDIPSQQLTTFGQTVWWLVAIRGLIFVPFGLYVGVWQYTGLSDLCNIAMAVIASTVASYATFHYALVSGYPRSVVVTDALLLVVCLSGIRLSRRVLRLVARRRGHRRVLIYGAGNAGEMLVRDMRSSPGLYEPVGFIDDDPAKRGLRIHGVAVVGSRKQLAKAISETKPHEVLVAMPSADAVELQNVVRSLQPFKVRISTVPSLRDILDGRVTVDQIRQLTIGDLLPRVPVELDPDDIRRLIAGRRILITGAGGSIGSELSRQIAALGPAALVLLERYENSLYELANGLADLGCGECVHPVIGDVTDPERIDQIMQEYRPEILFHAAAHKHVPLMECNPCEAVKNNVVGTATVAEAAERWGVERFILISTDKAVNPSSVMGATKAVCELILQTMSVRSATRFAAVRFGNVLGSNGSVLPRFLDQIRSRRPVTVTHPEIRRYFMLIPEAVQLVLHAATLGEARMTYVLEMGEQIKLVDLARSVIRLAGFVPEREIPISFVGLRPGEKLSEELVAADETAEPSPLPSILRLRRAFTPDPVAIREDIAHLVHLARRGDDANVVHHLRKMVRTVNLPAPDDDASRAVVMQSVTLRSADPMGQVCVE